MSNIQRAIQGRCLALLLIVCSQLLVLVPCLASAAGASEASGTTVLIYHRFGEDEYPTTNVSLDKFKEQMAWLQENGYRVIPLSELVERLHKGRELPENSVVITIDDGYRSTYTEAWPVLKEYGYPFTVFIYVGAVEKGYSNILTWEEIREMKESGVAIQSHSWGHPHLIDRPEGMDEREYRTWIHNDLKKAAETMEARLGEKPEHLAIPYGEYNSIVLEEGRSCGYQAVLTQDPGSASRETSPYFIPRDAILGDEWSTLEHFRKVLQRVDLPVRNRIPQPEPEQPAIVSRFGAELLYPERYVSGTVGVYVTGLGWRQAEREGNLFYIDNEKPLQKRISRVTVSAREKESGRTAQRTWMVLGPKEAPGQETENAEDNRQINNRQEAHPRER